MNGITCAIFFGFNCCLAEIEIEESGMHAW